MTWTLPDNMSTNIFGYCRDIFVAARFETFMAMKIQVKTTTWVSVFGVPS